MLNTAETHSLTLINRILSTVPSTNDLRLRTSFGKAPYFKNVAKSNKHIGKIIAFHITLQVKIDKTWRADFVQCSTEFILP